MRPPGAYLLGEAGLDQQQLRDWHRDRVQALQDGGVSFIAIETIPVSRYGEIHYSTTAQYSIKTNILWRAASGLASSVLCALLVVQSIQLSVSRGAGLT